MSGSKGVFLTHFHSDHIAELGELRLQTWVAGRREPLESLRPAWRARTSSPDSIEAYSHDADYRTAHHGEAFLPREDVDLVAVPIPMSGATASALRRRADLTVTAIRVHHGPVKPAYGYRFDFAGRSVTVSGDTAPYEPLAVAARGSDVLVHEAQSSGMVASWAMRCSGRAAARAAKIMHDIPGLSYHAGRSRAHRQRGACEAAGVHAHQSAAAVHADRRARIPAGVSDVRPKGWVLGHDGLLIRLPGHSDAIEQSGID